jgi:hypothetical protein
MREPAAAAIRTLASLELSAHALISVSSLRFLGSTTGFTAQRLVGVTLLSKVLLVFRRVDEVLLAISTRKSLITEAGTRRSTALVPVVHGDRLRLGLRSIGLSSRLRLSDRFWFLDFGLI